MNYWKVFKAIALALILAVSLTACGAGSETWREDVLLHDGSKIIVERSVSRSGHHEIGQPPPIKEQSLSFMLPSSNKLITWKSEYGEDVGRANFNLLALHILNGTPYLVVEPNLCLSYNKWGRPNPPYVFFKYDSEKWQRIQLSEFPAKFKTFNVTISLSSGTVEKMVKQGTVPAEHISEQNNSLTQPEYQTILREPIRLNINSSSVNCEVMVRFEDGWAGPDYVEMVKRNNFQLQKELERRRQKAVEPNTHK